MQSGPRMASASLCGLPSVAADGKTRVSTTTGTNAAGQKIHNVVVYDKQ